MYCFPRNVHSCRSSTNKTYKEMFLKYSTQGGGALIEYYLHRMETFLYLFISSLNLSLSIFILLLINNWTKNRIYQS